MAERDSTKRSEVEGAEGYGERPSRKGVLNDLKILDIGTMVAAPVAATLMADLGARVIKIEQPGIGDTLRGLGPFLENESLWWNVDGRNKKSITLNLRSEDGQQILKKLICDADVLVENFRPGTLEKWGLDYQVLSKINPSLIMLSISGFGQDGPLSSRAAYDRMGLAFSGVMGLTGNPDKPPVRVGISICDYLTATFGAFSVMAALHHRELNGGKGQQIDLALYEPMFRMTESLTAAYDRLGFVRARTGNIHYGGAPGDNFETKDGRFITLTCSGDVIFRKICEAMGRKDLLADSGLATHAKRWERVKELNRIVADWMKAKPLDEVETVLNSHGVAYAVVMTIEDIVRHPHYVARENIVSVDHPTLGRIKMQGILPRFSDVEKIDIKAAPSVGEHNREIYVGELGFDEREYEELMRRGVI